MISQHLSQSQKQSLKINPQQIQFLNFLQLNNNEVEDMIKKELEENPVLSEVDTDTETTPEGVEHPIIYQRNTSNAAAESTTGWETYRAVPVNLRDDLKEQLHYRGLSENEIKLGEFLIDSADEKGFINSDSEELEDVYSFATNTFVDVEQIIKVRKIVSRLEPIGVGTRDLKEFLILQAYEKYNDALLIEILEKHFDNITEHEFEAIEEDLQLDPEQLRNLLKLVSGMKPFPFYGIEKVTSAQPEVIVPDYRVTVKDGEIKAGILTGKKRNLEFNQVYIDQFIKSEDKKVKKFILGKMESAEWFRAAIEERNETMKACIAAVVKLQEPYFRTGDTVDLNPMILKDVAELTGKTISTISRVTSQKYVETDFGVISMKGLFSEAIQKANGQVISNREVQDEVQKIIDNEDKLNPLTDAEIQQMLESTGVELTRRTITKYREQLNIPSSKYRRTI